MPRRELAFGVWILTAGALGCPQGDCPEGYLRDNNGNCVLVDGDDDVWDDDDHGDDDGGTWNLQSRSGCYLNGEKVGWVFQIQVFDEVTGSRVGSGNSDADGWFCLPGIDVSHTYRHEWYDPATGDCLMWVKNLSLEQNAKWFGHTCDMDENGWDTPSNSPGDCNDWEPIYDCWGG